MPSFLTVKQLAESLGCDPGKILNWIHTGELEAINVSESAAGRPRWRIAADAWERFQLVRSNRATATRSRPKRRRRDDRVIEFF
jgi:excisionase family DNA binding protein